MPGGTRVFSLAFAWKAPYFRSVRPRFVQVSPNYAALVVPKRRAVQNHIGTVHAIAVCNGLEAAMGALAEASDPQWEALAAQGDGGCVPGQIDLRLDLLWPRPIRMPGPPYSTYRCT